MDHSGTSVVFGIPRAAHEVYMQIGPTGPSVHIWTSWRTSELLAAMDEALGQFETTHRATGKTGTT